MHPIYRDSMPQPPFAGSGAELGKLRIHKVESLHSKDSHQMALLQLAFK